MRSVRKGQEYVEDWLSKNASLVQVAESMDTAVGEFLKFKEQFRHLEGEQTLALFRSMFFFFCGRSD